VVDVCLLGKHELCYSHPQIISGHLSEASDGEDPDVCQLLKCCREHFGLEENDRGKKPWERRLGLSCLQTPVTWV
jgi:hypothetical protein